MTLAEIKDRLPVTRKQLEKKPTCNYQFIRDMCDLKRDSPMKVLVFLSSAVLAMDFSWCCMCKHKNISSDPHGFYYRLPFPFFLHDCILLFFFGFSVLEIIFLCFENATSKLYLCTDLKADPKILAAQNAASLRLSRLIPVKRLRMPPMAEMRPDGVIRLLRVTRGKNPEAVKTWTNVASWFRVLTHDMKALCSPAWRPDKARLSRFSMTRRNLPKRHDRMVCWRHPRENCF